MKCDELKEYYYYEDRIITPATHMYKVYHADKVDEAIAELKAELAEKDKDIAYWREEYDKETQLTDALKDEIESLKASHYAESVDAGMRERRLRRALYKVCAKWAFLAQWERGNLVENWEKWENVERKCRAKAEQYK